MYSLNDNALSTPISTTAAEYFGQRSSVRKSSVRTINSSSAASTHGPSLYFICSSSSWCGRSDVPAQSLELAALADEQHPGGVDARYQLHRRGGHVGQHVFDASRRSGGARQLGHSLSQVVVSRLRHTGRLPIVARGTRYRAAAARLSFRAAGHAANRWAQWSTIVLTEVSSVQTSSRRGRPPSLPNPPESLS